MSKTIHIAGFPVRVGNDFRQRCAWCGVVLIEYDYTRIAWTLPADGSPGEPPGGVEIGLLFAVDGNCSYIVQHEDGAKLPREWCGHNLPPPSVFAGTKGTA